MQMGRIIDRVEIRILSGKFAQISRKFLDITDRTINFIAELNVTCPAHKYLIDRLIAYQMKAYIIVDITITDPSRYEEYKKLTLATLQPFGGKFIVRGGKAEGLEGDWQPGRIVVTEFPSLEKAKAWWSSEAYAPAKAMRQSASVTQMIVVEGVA